MQLVLSKTIDYALLWRLEVAGVPEPWQWRPRDWRCIEQDQHASVGCYHVASGIVAAMGVIRQAPRARGFKCQAFELVRLVVAPGCRRRGVGRGLLTELHRQAAAAKVEAVATVPEELVEVQQFFRACGWMAVGTVPALDGGPGDAIRFHAGGSY